MRRYSGQKNVSIIYDLDRDHNPSFQQQRRSFNNITIVPVEERQRRLSFRIRSELTRYNYSESIFQPYMVP
uniref:Uncharacterized protein n=1 Tax=Schistosoma haematobium TaxID=6185 RepID=A0A095A1C5_SCHHA